MIRKVVKEMGKRTKEAEICDNSIFFISYLTFIVVNLFKTSYKSKLLFLFLVI